MTPPVPANARSQSFAQDRGIDEESKFTLTLLRQIEASLEAGQKALLEFDLDGVERGTREQIRMSGELQALLSADSAPHRAVHVPRERRSSSLPDDPDLTAELRHAQSRVRHLTLVQAALLRRAQSFHLILSNALAGSNLTYGPRLAPDNGPHMRLGLQLTQEESSCRA